MRSCFSLSKDSNFVFVFGRRFLLSRRPLGVICGIKSSFVDEGEICNVSGSVIFFKMSLFDEVSRVYTWREFSNCSSWGISCGSFFGVDSGDVFGISAVCTVVLMTCGANRRGLASAMSLASATCQHRQ